MKSNKEGLCNSLKSLCIGSTVKQPSVKCRLSNMLTDSSDEEEAPVVTRRVSLNSESEDDALPATIIVVC